MTRAALGAVLGAITALAGCTQPNREVDDPTSRAETAPGVGYRLVLAVGEAACAP